MSRKEKKKEADKKRLEIASQIFECLKEAAKTIPKELKDDAHGRWSYILKRGDEWVISRMKLYPQEAHMYKSAAIICVKNVIQEVLKGEKEVLKEEKDG